MTAAAILDRLCERYRIATGYRDIWGQRHTVPEQTRRALLAAMGLPTESVGAMQRALAQAQAADRSRALPPVQVVREDADRLVVPVAIRAEDKGHRHAWILIQEDGRRETGEFLPDDLDPRGGHQGPGENRKHYDLVLPAVTATGYHRLELRDLERTDADAALMTLIVAPRTCYQPQAVRGGGRVWGPAIQLYAVRSARNWGIGDFTDLLRVLEFSAQSGAGLVGLNPLHALFPHDPAHASPYSPSSRLFLNVLYLDVEAVEDFAECERARQRVAEEAFQARLRALRAREQVDYPGVAAAKFEILEILYAHFRRHHPDAATGRGAAFRRFQEERGESLQQHGLYEALQAWLNEQDAGARGWPAWPEAYRDPRSQAVTAFAAEQRERVLFFQYLQWQAQLQLEAAGRRAHELELDVGLYQDLAVSVDAGGAEAWANQELYALQAHIGSPPDDFNLKGQDWGLPPWRPEQLRAQGYAPFIETLRHNMRIAGALRIDHVMALMRLFWVAPEAASGDTPVAGTYVFYPFQDLLGILALESQRNRCLVIGEDLGTVPDQVREALHPMGVLSYRLLYFEKDADGGFRAPDDFEPQAVVAASTHDLPTLTGYWQGRDLELREQLGLFPNAELCEQQVIARAEDRVRLLMALQREQLLPAGMGVDAVSVPEMTPELAEAIHRYLARTPARVMVVQLEDVLGQSEQINLPGTTDQHPNWCRKLTLNVELWAQEPRVPGLLAAVHEERGSAISPPSGAPSRRAVATQPGIPQGTYRLQLHKDFDFDRVAGLVPYLRQLGITHCYASPCLQARPGSTHGYDIVDHTALNAELGGDEGFARLSNALREHGMGLILDMVPNHMGVMGGDNTWWLDVLENGPASVYASFFDIDWQPLKDALRGKVLLPVLGDHYGSVLDSGDLELVFDATSGAFRVGYFEHVFPIDPREYPRILGEGGDRLAARLGSDHPRLPEFEALVTAFGHLPPRSASDPAAIKERNRDKDVYKAQLARLYQDADIGHFVDENVAALNSDIHVDRLHELLEAQAWRLAYWRVASDEINYRRFFDINELAGLRMENPEVFTATHRRTLELIAQGAVQGLRIDHPDGLHDPAGYFRQLQASVAAGAPVTAGEERPDPSAAGERPLYLLVEKVLAANENLRGDWAVHGTTGYEFTNLVNGLFVDSEAAEQMERLYRRFVPDGDPLQEIVYQAKKRIMHEALAGELHVLAQQLSRLAEMDRHTRDFTLSGLREALSEIVACFPVYRTYVDAHAAGELDRHYLDRAVEAARRRSRVADLSIFDFTREVLLTDIARGCSPDHRKQIIAFAMKFQQYTGPLMAKGLEDTAFYRYNRLVSLNEVGGRPERFGITPDALHRHNQRSAQEWPHAMLGTSTHDSKRSEDVRARINVLSEMPDEWGRRVTAWARLNRASKRGVGGRPAPSGNDEYLLYQTLVGAWPLQHLDAAGLAAFRDRIQAYMLKAVKEAKQHTSWVHSDPDYEQAVSAFVASLLRDAGGSGFLADFVSFVKPVCRMGLCNSLAQTLFKLTAPGVPDIYQGNELWDFSLVDPDNRRPVDYRHRQALLAQLQTQVEQAGCPADVTAALMRELEDGRAKLYLTWRGLQLRQRFAALFGEGDYLALSPGGDHAEHLCAFARRHGSEQIVTVVPRLIYRLAGGEDPLGEGVWGDTWLEVPARGWENVLTGERLEAEASGDGIWRLRAAALLRHFPVALLLAKEKKA